MAATLAPGGKALPFLVAAGIVYEIVAAACSSPQTAEINADRRAETLMKWVYIGLGQSALFIGVAALAEPDKAVPIIAGGGLAAGIMYWSYAYAKKSGLENPGPPTEDYGDTTDAVYQHSQEAL
jgi:hypothetical protein